MAITRARCLPSISLNLRADRSRKRRPGPLLQLLLVLTLVAPDGRDPRRQAAGVAVLAFLRLFRLL
jgi:hypothetical protein